MLMLAFLFMASQSDANIGLFDKTADWGGPDSPPRRGMNKVPGSASYSGGVYSIAGQGDDIWDESDEGYFLYTELSGSQSITGRVIWEDTNNSDWAKIGLMMREKGGDSRSRHYMCLLRGALYGDLCGVQWRSEHGGVSDWANIHPPDNPNGFVSADADAAIWFRVSRIMEEGLVVSEWSYNGIDWNIGHMSSMTFPETIAWGIAITNHRDNQQLAFASVEGLTIGEPDLDVVFGRRSVAAPSYFQTNTFYKAGDSLTVTLTLNNISDRPLSVDIFESIPEGWIVSNISNGGQVNDSTIQWPAFSVPPGKFFLQYQLSVPDRPKPLLVFGGTVGTLRTEGDRFLSHLADGVGIFDGHVDLGEVSEAGSVRFNSDWNEYEVFGSGQGIRYLTDEFHFLYKEVHGPFSIRGTIDLDPLESKNAWAKAGLMVRDNLTADSTHASIMIRGDYQHDPQWRSVQNGMTFLDALSADNVGEFEIEKIGDTIRFYYISAKTGERICSRSLIIPMTDPVYVGLAVSSQDDGNLSVGYFKDVEFRSFDGYAERSFGSSTLPIEGGRITGNRIKVNVRAGRSMEGTLTEVLPEGFTVDNVQTTHGQVDVGKGVIRWALNQLTDSAVMTYDMNVPASLADRLALFNGSFADLPIGGENAIIPIAFRVPFLDRSVVLDGILSPGEYQDAYQEIFDHSDRIPPGVHIEPKGGEMERGKENAVLYLFHNEEFIYVAVDVTDSGILDFESGGEVWMNDSTELYIDGNLSRSESKENDLLGFQATVLGNGGNVSGNDAPAIIPLASGGGSTHQGGKYWNAGARVKDSGKGYIVEYAVNKSLVLDPPERLTIGFDVHINGANGTGTRTSKWAYWNTRLDRMPEDFDYWDNEQGWAVIELGRKSNTRLLDWDLY